MRDGKDWIFSPSQIATFRRCNRLWAFEKLDGNKPPPGKGAERGTKLHSMVEAWLEKGTPIDQDDPVGAMAMKGVWRLPLPKSPGMKIELPIAFKYEGIRYRGKQDIEIAPQYSGSGLPEIWDHKSCASFVWALDEEGLRTDLQAAVYGYAAMQRWNSDRVRQNWVYYPEQGAESRLVQITSTLSEVREVLDAGNESAREALVLLKAKPRALDVVPNYNGCDQYGGCHFKKDVCKPTAKNVLKGLFAQGLTRERKQDMERDTKAFTKELRARKASQDVAEDAKKKERQEKAQKATQFVKDKLDKNTEKPTMKKWKKTEEAPKTATKAAAATAETPKKSWKKKDSAATETSTATTETTETTETTTAKKSWKKKDGAAATETTQAKDEAPVAINSPDRDELKALLFTESTQLLGAALDMFVDLLADKVAARLKK